MYSGTVQDCVAAINTAKETRGDRVGCPDASYSYTTRNTTPPTLSAVETLWNTVHAPGLNAYNESCAQLGREWPAAALGGWYARLAGYSVSSAALRAIADSVAGAQYSSAHAPEPLVTYPGVYGYSHELAEVGNPCYRGGAVADGINQWCGTVPSYCPTYDAGPWAGIEFLVVDFSLSPRAYDGGLAYDHGWSAAMMMEASLQEGDATRQAAYQASHTLAADWSGVESTVRNHNYVAKNVWALAQEYALLGNSVTKDALIDKLERSLKAGVLMDANSDGLVDGMANQPFSGLTQNAQLPGRYWDGHNSQMWYQSMNAWGLAEAYVAFRDRGDSALAGDLRPYVDVTLNNLASEINSRGPIAVSEQALPVPHALLVALWKIADYENESHPDWEDALWNIYNTGYFGTFDNGRRTGNAGLLLCWMAGTPYVPLDLRFIATPPGQASTPNPANGATGVSTSADLGWSAGSGATTHDVYFGTANPPAYVGNQPSTTYDPGTLAPGTTYYWRIDECGANGMSPGTLWSFTTASGGSCPLSVEQPDGFAVIQGTLKSGNLASLINDDNNFLRAGSSSKPAVSVDFDLADGCYTGLSQLRVFVRSKDSSSSITRKLYLWNNSTSAWDLVGQNTVGTSESNLQVTVTSGLSNYVTAAGLVKVGVEQVRLLFSHDMYVEKVEVGVNGG